MIRTYSLILYLLITKATFGFGFILHPVSKFLKSNHRPFDKNLCIERPKMIFGSFPVFDVRAGDIQTFYINPFNPTSLESSSYHRKPVRLRILRFSSTPSAKDSQFSVHKLLTCIPNEAYLRPSYREEFDIRSASKIFINKQN